jgi:hypothetical protein
MKQIKSFQISNQAMKIISSNTNYPFIQLQEKEDESEFTDIPTSSFIDTITDTNVTQEKNLHHSPMNERLEIENEIPDIGQNHPSWQLQVFKSRSTYEKAINNYSL